MTTLPPRPLKLNGENGRYPFSPRFWSGKRVSNSRPQPWQGCALPTELFPRCLAIQLSHALYCVFFSLSNRVIFQSELQALQGAVADTQSSKRQNYKARHWELSNRPEAVLVQRENVRSVQSRNVRFNGENQTSEAGGTMITMSQKEVSRLRVLEQIVQGALNQEAAADVLQLSVCQLRRIQRRYEAGGASAGSASPSRR